MAITGQVPTGLDPTDNNESCFPSRLASLYDMDTFFRAKVYGDIDVSATEWKALTERDNSYLHTDFYADRCVA